MSDHWIRFVPVDPQSTPTRAAAADALAYLRALAPNANSVEAAFKDQVEFFHPGGNWEGVTCPRCAADLEDWWPEAMDRAYAAGFSDLGVVTPCCGAAVSLNDLDYAAPSAFGRFALEAMNAGIGDIGDAVHEEIARRLGLAVRTVWTRI